VRAGHGASVFVPQTKTAKEITHVVQHNSFAADPTLPSPARNVERAMPARIVPLRVVLLIALLSYGSDFVPPFRRHVGHD
jgi:hypothetical protein